MAIHDSYYTKQFRELAGFHRIKETSIQVDFIEKTLSLPAGAKVLDMGCGFGRHSIPLAQKGYAVTGYDASADYLDEARRAAQEAGVKVSFKQMDMRKLDDERQFDAVISMSSSLAFYDDEANALVGVDGRAEAVIYMTAVGNPSRPFGGSGRVDLRHTGRPKE